MEQTYQVRRSGWGWSTSTALGVASSFFTKRSAVVWALQRSHAVLVRDSRDGPLRWARPARAAS